MPNFVFLLLFFFLGLHNCLLYALLIHFLSDIFCISVIYPTWYVIQPWAWSINNRWLIFMLSFSSWYPHSIPQSIIDNGINTMTKSSGERVSPWQIPLLMFTSPNIWLFPVRIVSTVPCYQTGVSLCFLLIAQFHWFLQSRMWYHFIGYLVINPAHCKSFTCSPTISQNSFIYQQLVFCASRLFSSAFLFIR